MIQSQSMKIYLISPVHGYDFEEHHDIGEYVSQLESEGHVVHWPARDTDRGNAILSICTENMAAIRDADRVDIWWDVNSSGSKFDLGVAFALGKEIRRANLHALTSYESFINLIAEWVDGQIEEDD